MHQYSSSSNNSLRLKYGPNDRFSGVAFPSNCSRRGVFIALLFGDEKHGLIMALAGWLAGVLLLSLLVPTT